MVVVALAACGDGATPTPTPQINQVSFNAFDYGYGRPSSIPAGMTTISMVNEGVELHHQQLIKLPEGMAGEDLLAALAQGPAAGPPPPGLKSAGGVSVLAPGGKGTVTVNLEQGNYLMICFIPDSEGVPHFARGMAMSLTVTEAAGHLAAEPDSDMTIDMFDFGYTLSAPISTDTKSIRVTNGGPQDHETWCSWRPALPRRTSWPPSRPARKAPRRACHLAAFNLFPTAAPAFSPSTLPRGATR